MQGKIQLFAKKNPMSTRSGYVICRSAAKALKYRGRHLNWDISCCSRPWMHPVALSVPSHDHGTQKNRYGYFPPFSRYVAVQLRISAPLHDAVISTAFLTQLHISDRSMTPGSSLCCRISLLFLGLLAATANASIGGFNSYSSRWEVIKHNI